MKSSREASVRHSALRSAFPVGRYVTPRACNDNISARRAVGRRGRTGSAVSLGVFVAAAWAMVLVWMVYQLSLWAGH